MELALLACAGMADEPVLRVIVFVDDSNVYRDARRAFGDDISDPAWFGQINPMRFGMRLADRQPLGTTEPRRLEQVRVYCGLPSSSKQPKSYGAKRRQIAAWTKAGIEPKPRPLRYPQDWPNSRPEQKGVDVEIAIDVVVMGLRGQLDVAVIASTDTDLRPAIEAFELLPFTKPVLVEVAAWRSPLLNKRLDVDGQHVWCHWLERGDFDAVRDRRDYNVAT
jgi:uncharacterized LabA/DUF88 family protein